MNDASLSPAPVKGRRTLMAVATGALLAGAAVAAFCIVDFAWNNAPNESTGLSPEIFEALKPDTTNETVVLLKQKLAAASS